VDEDVLVAEEELVAEDVADIVPWVPVEEDVEDAVADAVDDELDDDVVVAVAEADDDFDFVAVVVCVASADWLGHGAEAIVGRSATVYVL
jgi:hypothetical protein